MQTQFLANYQGRLRGLAGVLLLTLPSLAQQYNSNDLTPPNAMNGKLNGASSGKQAGGGGNGHALLESGNALTSIDLHPSFGYSSSMATATDDVDQCGYAYSSSGFGNHASKWSGSAASFVDLHSSTGMTYSYCLGTHGGQQVGYGERPVYFTTYQNAMVWNGNVATNLHPLASLSAYSKALAVRAGQQVGYLSTAPYPYGETTGYHALSAAAMWTGSAASMVSLHPVGFAASEAWATNGTQQGGWVYTSVPSSQHAALWSGTPESLIDLHPVGYNDSGVRAMSGGQQVGDGWVGPMGGAGSVRHALVWSGTAQSVVDLNQYLPPGYTHAAATGIDANGNVVGYAYNTPSSGLTIPADAIAVVFAPGQATSTLASLSLGTANPAPGAPIAVTLTLNQPAGAGGVTVTFVSTNPSLLPTPGALVVPGGQQSATFTLAAGGAGLQAPAVAKLYATDGSSSRQATATVTPIVSLSSVSVNAVEGGFLTNGTLSLTIPAQAGGAIVSLATSSTAITLPASVTIPQGAMSATFSVTTSSVTVATTIPVTATYKGLTVSGSATLSPAPVVAVSSITIPIIVGGQQATGTVTVGAYPRNPEGVLVTLTSGDTRTLQVPATVLIPQYGTSATFPVTTTVVSGAKGVSVKAAYGASNLTTTVSVIPIPTITIVQADYLTDLQMLKVAITTATTGSTFTFGTSPLGPAVGTLQFELGQYKGATITPVAPATVTVWSSDGGTATMAVTQKLSSAGGGGGGATTSPKLTINRSSKGNVVSNPSAISCGSNGNTCSATFTAGATVTLTATPDAGLSFTAWTGACTGTSLTCTLTMSADKVVTPNFK